MNQQNNNALYAIIWILILVIVWGLSYFLWQNNSKNTSSNTTNTPLVAEAWRLWIDTDDLNKCIAENKFLDKINSQMKVWADTFGISWTPWNVLINNETWEYSIISWAYPKEKFIKEIDKLLSNDTTSSWTTTKTTTNSNKTFKENTSNKALTVITDKRDSSVQTEQLIASLQQIPAVKDLKIERYDFSDSGVKEFLKENNIKVLPAILFTSNKVDDKINQYLTKINDNSYSLNVWAKFDPFAKLSSKGFKIINKNIIEKIKKGSYIDWKKDAKITWLEYSDLECPFCQKLHNSDVKSSLKAKYGDNLNIVFNHFPLWFHQNAIPWANILECVWELGWAEDFYKIMEYAYKNKIQK